MTPMLCDETDDTHISPHQVLALVSGLKKEFLTDKGEVEYAKWVQKYAGDYYTIHMVILRLRAQA